MTFSEAQQKGHGLSNVLSKIVLGTTVRPDFNIEEKASIEKDSREMKQIIREMADYLPKEDPVKGWWNGPCPPSDTVGQIIEINANSFEAWWLDHADDF